MRVYMVYVCVNMCVMCLFVCMYVCTIYNLVRSLSLTMLGITLPSVFGVSLSLRR